jgi:magnesium transporter
VRLCSCLAKLGKTVIGLGVFMITVLKGESGNFEKINELLPDVWVNLVNPKSDEITRLHRELGIPYDFLTSAQDMDERSRTDKEGNTHLILLRIPRFLGRTVDIPFATIPLAIIFSDDFIITVSQEESSVIQDFLTGQVAGWSTAKRNQFLLKLLLRTAIKYLEYLRQIDKEIDVLENKLQLSMRNKELLELLKYQKSFVYFTTALESNELMMERLQRSEIFDKFPEDQELLQDVLIENQQAIEMVGISNNILSQMMDVFASIISNNLNVVMKFLTSVTIVLMAPTLVASFYGMNVRLPLQDSSYAFLFTLLVSFGISLIVVIIFLKEDWF